MVHKPVSVNLINKFDDHQSRTNVAICFKQPTRVRRWKPA